MLSDTERAYIAGLFDGEGTIGYYLKKSHGCHVASAAIYNSDPIIMEWLTSRLPYGSVSSNNSLKSTHKAWIWCLSGKIRVSKFLQLIRPFLVIKAEQVDLLLSSWDAEQRVGGIKSGTKLSKEVLEIRENTEKELRLLKTSHFQRIPVTSIPLESGIDPYADLTRDT